MNLTIRNYMESQKDSWKFLEPLQDDGSNSVGYLIKNPWPVLVLTIAYITTVCFIGPRYMRNREPFKLKLTIRIYNLIEVILAGYLFHRMHAAIGNLRNLLDCNKMFSFTDGSAESIFLASDLILFIRSSEYLDTIFFTLRKKHSQITFLHVYHHAFVPLYAYWVLRTAPTVFNVYIITINSIIHVIMYLYYFLATFDNVKQIENNNTRGSQNLSLMMTIIRQVLLLKKYLTLMQIGQFISLLIYAIWAGNQANCQIPRTYIIANLYVALSFLALFVHFYLNNYKRAPRPKQQ